MPEPSDTAFAPSARGPTLKDEFGARHVRVREPTKVACHLMFGLLALTPNHPPRRSIAPADQTH